jgi:hypothetical protein
MEKRGDKFSVNEWEKMKYRLGLAKSKFRRSLLSAVFLHPRPWQRSRVVIPYPLVFFSGARDFPELYFSIQSFLAFAGTPTAVYVVTDGSMTASHATILSASFPLARMIDWSDVEKKITYEGLLTFSRKHPLGKKLSTIIQFNTQGPFLFSDSDILYFMGARRLSDHLKTTTHLFLEDCSPAFDPRIIPNPPTDCSPTNTGFLFINKSIPWADKLDFVDRNCLEGPLHHTEQTIIHLALRSVPSKVLNRKKFVVETADQFLFSDSFYSPSIILRHYVQPVRYKFWNLPLNYYLRIFLKA